MLAPGIPPSRTLEQHFALELLKRKCDALPKEVAVKIALKLKRENQLLRTALIGLSDELSQTTRIN